jgi:putative ABC transport system permease protein
VAAFLLNVLLTRLMATQRGQIAILKAFGYTTTAIVVHFLKMTVLIIAAGLVLGIWAGSWMGRGMSNMYLTFYRFPYLDYVLRPEIIGWSALISLGTGMVGVVWAVVHAAGEAPAVAMQPAAPSSYRVSLLERAGIGRGLSQPGRMILRNIERRPWKALFSAAGIALSTAILVMGGFWGDAVDFAVDVQFRQAQRDDLQVTFVEAVSSRALSSLRSLPGVTYAEPMRSVAARFRFGHRSYRAAVVGLEPDGDLRRLLDDRLEQVDLPPEGILLTDFLADTLGVRPGDLLTVELLEGNRAVRQAPVVATVKEFIGVSGYMDRHALNRLLREGEVVTAAFLAADMENAPVIYSKLKEMPAVAGTTARRRVLESFYETMAKQMMTFAFFNTVLAGIIAIGVVYNTARIALSERSRELASLRVLGYTRAEVSFILLGELAVLVLAGIPAGMVIGRGLAWTLLSGTTTDLYRFPLIILPGTYAFAALVVLIAAVLSGIIVRRRIDHLDLVEVLKTRE